MSSKVPIARSIAWVSLIPQSMLVVFLYWIWWMLGVADTLLYVALSYLALSLGIRLPLTRHHKKGMSLVKKEKFSEAIAHFEKSYRFFKRYEWIDKYRYLTLLTNSKMSYREMALCNIAFCYGQIGDIDKSLEYYQQALNEFPDSVLAKTAFRLLKSAEVTFGKR